MPLLITILIYRGSPACSTKVFFLRVLPKWCPFGAQQEWDKVDQDIRKRVNKVSQSFQDTFDSHIYNKNNYQKFCLVGINTQIERRKSPKVVSFSCVNCGAVPSITCEECGFARFCSPACEAAASERHHTQEMCTAYKLCATAAQSSEPPDTSFLYSIFEEGLVTTYSGPESLRALIAAVVGPSIQVEIADQQEPPQG